MAAYAPYVKEIEKLLSSLEAENSKLLERTRAILDGEAYTRLREIIQVGKLRAAGAFFTSSGLAKAAVAPIAEDLEAGGTVLDPACGAGDLLLACTPFMPATSSLRETIHTWANRLAGIDTQPQFTRAARLRLALAAVSQSSSHDVSKLEAASRLRKIRTGDAFEAERCWSSATHILLNPPFTMTTARHGCDWAGGKVSVAALFVERALKKAQPGTIVVAILPDVLRSGSRYESWRAMVESKASLADAVPWGRFDEKTDIDVFILRIVIGNGQSRATWTQETTTCRLADLVDVRVGPVVEFRHAENGQLRPYLTPATVPPWAEIKCAPQYRRFAGTIFEPPFVVVRRTSRPGDRHRAVASIVDLSEPVAVENHLLVLRPQDRQLSTCRRVVKILEGASTTDWLNSRIRCRHLTVDAIKDLPVSG